MRKCDNSVCGGSAGDRSIHSLSNRATISAALVTEVLASLHKKYYYHCEQSGQLGSYHADTYPKKQTVQCRVFLYMLLQFASPAPGCLGLPLPNQEASEIRLSLETIQAN